MLKRVLAWALLVGFVLLLLNIAIFQYYLELCIVLYLGIAIWFIFTNKPLPSRKKKSKKNTGENAEDPSIEFKEEELLEYIDKTSKETNGENNIE